MKTWVGWGWLCTALRTANVACMVNGAGLAMSTMDTWIILWTHLNMAKKGLPQGPKQPKETTVGGLTFNLSSCTQGPLEHFGWKPRQLPGRRHLGSTARALLIVRYIKVVNVPSPFFCLVTDQDLHSIIVLRCIKYGNLPWGFGILGDLFFWVLTQVVPLTVETMTMAFKTFGRTRCWMLSNQQFHQQTLV